MEKPTPNLEPMENKTEQAPESGLDSLRELNIQLEHDVLRMVSQKETENAEANLMPFNEYPVANFKNEVTSIILEMFPDKVESDGVVFRPVPEQLKGDFSIMIPSLQNAAPSSDKAERKLAGVKYINEILPQIAARLQESISFPIEIEQKGIYLNITLDRKHYVSSVLASVEKLGEEYGNSDFLKGKRIVIDFSSPNIAKTMHVGHLRSTIIGQVLINILKSCGAVTYGVNHLGDWGTQFGQLVTAYKIWGEELSKEIDIEKEPVKFLAELYSKIKKKIKHEEDQDEQPLTLEGRKNFALLEAGNPEIVELWKKFRDLSLLEFDKIYSRLGIEHDIELGESFYEDKMGEVIQEVKNASNIAFQSEDGAWVLDFEDVGFRKGIFITADGRSVYATRDVAGVRHRRKSFNVTDILYVIGTEQKLHLEQIFETSKRLGDLDGIDAKHIAFGMIKKRDKTGKLSKISSREGAGGLAEILDSITDTAEERLKGREGISDEERRGIAEKIGIGALIYSNFSQQISKDMEFDPNSMLDIDSQTAPYLQYTCVRISSLLEKNKVSDSINFELNDENVNQLSIEAQNLIDLVAKFPEILATSASKHIPHYLAEYLYNLSRAFNLLYSKEKISVLSPEMKSVYLRVINAVNVVLNKGLACLNIEVPEKM